MDIEQPLPASTHRYARKKEAIVAAAAGILNRRGIKGMTLADVAASVDLITTSVTYYFKKKEDLAVACFLASIERFDTLIAASLGAPDPRERLHRFLSLYLDLNRRIRLGEEAPMAMFNDIRALKEPHLSRVVESYNAMFRRVRTLFHAPCHDGIDRKMATARAHVLMEQIFWSVAWLGRYDVEDYPRIGERMLDILANGLAKDGARWAPPPVTALAPPGDSARDTFLTAATRLINQRGYRGASVEKISAQLNVTKGSFYHHNEAKDDLVVACFARSFAIMRKVQSAAMKLPGDQWDRLAAAAAALADYQVSDNGPLLRTSAISALPEAIRQDVLSQWNRVSDRFSAMISDGIAEGSLRAVDPVIAAQLLNATLNAAASLTSVVRGADRSEAAALYAKPMLMGLFSN
ncbi:MAG TPA: TetR/AcrR family transcriptional regulator [Rhizomicrobium sp.]|nr:TetR/AcrR family transcriptional regulator [Rhizomicrobium sp.]